MRTGLGMAAALALSLIALPSAAQARDYHNYGSGYGSVYGNHDGHGSRYDHRSWREHRRWERERARRERHWARMHRHGHQHDWNHYR